MACAQTVIMAMPMTLPGIIWMVTMVEDPGRVKAYIESHGIAGVLVFMGMNYLQVIAAVIPGGPFQIAAGYAFGVLKGSLICDIAMTMGAGDVYKVGEMLLAEK